MHGVSQRASVVSRGHGLHGTFRCGILYLPCRDKFLVFFVQPTCRYANDKLGKTAGTAASIRNMQIGTQDTIIKHYMSHTPRSGHRGALLYLKCDTRCLALPLFTLCRRVCSAWVLERNSERNISCRSRSHGPVMHKSSMASLSDTSFNGPSSGRVCSSSSRRPSPTITETSRSGVS